MTFAIAYIVLLSAAIASLATVAEHLLGRGRIARRWIWAAALALMVPVTLFVMLAPRPDVVAEATVPIASGEVPLSSAAMRASGSSSGTSYLPLADAALGWGWLAASTILLLAIGGGQWHLARARRRARPGTVHGHSVLVTDDLGPAVAGLTQPVVLLPRWVIALDDGSQRLLLAHEFEHARTRDTMLLMGGAVVAALLPWNPVVWWLTWRLRVAVELDCDSRVLSANPAIRQYVDLLLLAAGRNRLSARLLAAHFGEYTSDLERRICAMTDSRVKLRPVLVALATSAVLVAAACEAPRPDPVAPSLTTPESGPVIEERPVTHAIAVAPGSRYPRYPEILRQAGVEGTVLVSFVVTETGEADVASLKLIQTTHELFAVAVREALSGMRFTATSGKAKLVTQRVEQPFTFVMVGDETGQREVRSNSRPGALVDVVVSGVSSSRVREPKARPSGEPTIVLRGARTLGVEERPNILVRSIAGEELRRYLADSSKGRFKSPLGDIDPQDIEAIEVLKGRAACPAPAQPCPLITVTVKRGREAAYRAK